MLRSIISASVAIGFLWSGAAAETAKRDAELPRPVLSGDGSDNRWTFSHMRELRPTGNIAHDRSTAKFYNGETTHPDDLVLSIQGEDVPLKDIIASQYIDGLAIVKDGELIVEGYYGALKEGRPHTMFSTTKSLIGTIMGIYIGRGEVDPAAYVETYLPELAGTAYEGISVQDLIDMRAPSRFVEDYEASDGGIAAYLCAAQLSEDPSCPEDGPVGIYEFMQTIEYDEANSDRFVYKTVDTDVAAWILERVSGNRLPEIISEEVWQPMGAVNDAYISSDRAGGFMGGGGMSSSLRDYARFGALMANYGQVDDAQIVPRAFVEDLMNQPGDANWPMPSSEGVDPYYRAFWWGIGDGSKAFAAHGIHGQALFVFPEQNFVVAIYSSWPRADGTEQANWGNLYGLAGALAQKFLQ